MIWIFSNSRDIAGYLRETGGIRKPGGRLAFGNEQGYPPWRTATKDQTVLQYHRSIEIGYRNFRVEGPPIGREPLGYGKINDGTAEYDFIKSNRPADGKQDINAPSNSQKWAIAYFNQQIYKSYEDLPACYNDIGSNSSSFWNFLRFLKEKGFEPCWNNVDKVYFEMTLSYRAEEILSRPYEKDGKKKSLLQREIKIAEPDIVLFATGETYYKSIFTALQYTGAVTPPIPEKSEKCLVKIAEIDGVRYYWCDHPGGLTAKKFTKQDILNYIVKNLK